jgi:hypothetical protein
VNRLSGVSIGVVLIFAAAAVACDDGPSAPSSTPAPAPAPAPAPPPPAPTFSVSGSIVETPPTAGRPVENVQVSIENGPSATSQSDGLFSLSGVAAGTHSVRFSKTDFETRMLTVTVGSSDVTGLVVSLPPANRIVSAEYEGKLAPEEATCHGTSRSCDDYPAGAHHPGRVEAFVTWPSDNTELDLELRCNNELVEEAFKKGGTTEELSATVRGGEACRIHVLHSGEPVTYRLFLKHPN